MVLQEPEVARLAEPDALTIFLVGDPSVGKTSLINTLVKGKFDPNLPATLKNLTLSAKVTPDHVPLKIVDYSEREQTTEDLEQLVGEADVICIIYSAIDQVGIDRVKDYWVPVTRKYQAGSARGYRPIIVAANKTDLLSDIKVAQLREPSQEFENVEAVIDVSAATQKNVVELFYLAQKVVLYPLAPLFDSHLRALTKKCRSALIDIFRLCDHDGDGMLNDLELNLFHENCFGTPLQEGALDDLKSIIKQSTMEGISNDSITQTGFLFLHTFSIDRGRHAFTWRVLRKFNYDNQINTKSEPKKLAVEMADDFATKTSLSIRDSNHETGAEIIEEPAGISSLLDLPRIRENSQLIKAGVGLAVATLISMLALKFLVQDGSKGSN